MYTNCDIILEWNFILKATDYECLRITNFYELRIRAFVKNGHQFSNFTPSNSQALLAAICSAFFFT